ncbi:response regulator [Oscillochloris sp. ZM17-4]|uniref:response regulator n=1 Tax=Oscillochloris sp. ZM17-4 TaxID=2866714 RepID=UPI001C73B30E|nr:response regulator [Oscillochloris sp. ZM17-4]MBX0329670.1 response regulator [Oscillochloris sp. ZM17-4]
MQHASPSPDDPPVPQAPLLPDDYLNIIPDAVILTDAALRITGWNPAAELLYGWSAAEALGRRADELLQSNYPGVERAQLQAQGLWRGEVRHHHRDGHAMLILATVTWMRDPDGQPRGTMSLNRDISAHEQQLISVLEAVSGRIWSVDRELRLLVGNARFQQDVQQITGQELRPGESIWALPMPQEWQATWRAAYARALAGEVFSIERQHAGITIIYRLMPIRTAEGDISGVTVFGLDITPRVQARTARRQTERKLGALFELLPVGVSILDAEQRVVYANPALSQILRLDQQALVQGAYHTRQYLRVDGSPMPTEELAIARVFAERRAISAMEIGIVTETGEQIWVEVSAMPVDFPDWRVVAITADITARKRAEQERQRAQQTTELLYRASQLLARPLGQDAVLTTLLDLLQQLIPYDSANIMLPDGPTTFRVHYLRGYETWADPEAVKALIVDPAERPPLAQIIATRRSLLIADTHQEPTWQPMLETRYIGCWLGVPLMANNTLVGIFSIDRHQPHALTTDDVRLAETLAVSAATAIERAQLLAQLRDERAQLARRVAERTADLSLANAELSRATRLKDEFLASMSHELRTPLNAILGRAEAMQEAIYGPVTPEQIASLQGIEESGRHLLSLINDILDLSKIEAGRLELDAERVQVDLLCPLCLRMVAQSALMKRISLSSNYDVQVQTLHVDERRLKQILVNLLSNAVKFTPEGGKVGLEVHGDLEEQVVIFTVWDTGIGIAAEDMPKLFQPFVQIDSSLSRQYTGTGLGLALVARLAKAHGGSVRVESTPGEGSRFHVTLPWTPSAPGLGSTPEPTALPEALPAIGRAMVVEDSPTAAEQLTRYLQELGARVEVLPHGAGVLARAIALQPDVILLDILLPDDDGWHVLRQLKAEPRTQAIPIIVVSVVDKPEQARALGAAAALLKPIDRAGLELTLRRVLARQEEIHLQLALVATPATGRPKLLLAEDNEANIATIGDYLRAKGYDLMIARNGSEAVMRAQEERLDAILMDIQMPGMDGLEAIRRIRADTSLAQIPIIAATALAMPGDRERCLSAGADEYVTKPIQLRKLVTTIERLRNTGSEGA